MSDIDKNIKELEDKLLELRKQKDSGYFSCEKNYLDYDKKCWHIVIYSTDKKLAGIIVDEGIVQKYLDDKNNANKENK